MYTLVILGLSLLGDINIVALGGFKSEEVCAAVAQQASIVMLRDQVGAVPNSPTAACLTENQFDKFVDAVGDRAKQMEMEGVKAQNSKT
jgi:hypothetical protein